MGNKVKVIEGGQKPKKQNQALPIETDDMTASLNIVISSIRKSGGRPCKYEADADGLERFREKTLEFFEYVNEINQNPEIENKIIPDIESWAVYLGTTRKTILDYARRSDEWQETIELYKNAIASVKKEMAFHYKVPPMFSVFDLANNHSYKNTSEFKIEAQAVEQKEAVRKPEEIIQMYGNLKEIPELPQLPDD